MSDNTLTTLMGNVPSRFVRPYAPSKRGNTVALDARSFEHVC